MAAKVVLDPYLKEDLLLRYPFYPIENLLKVIQRELARRYPKGSDAPSPPYAEGTKRIDITALTGGERYRVVPIYYYDSEDAAVVIISVGIWPEP